MLLNTVRTEIETTHRMLLTCSSYLSTISSISAKMANTSLWVKQYVYKYSMVGKDHSRETELYAIEQLLKARLQVIKITCLDKVSIDFKITCINDYVIIDYYYAPAS